MRSAAQNCKKLAEEKFNLVGRFHNTGSEHFRSIYRGKLGKEAEKEQGASALLFRLVEHRGQEKLSSQGKPRMTMVAAGESGKVAKRGDERRSTSPSSAWFHRRRPPLLPPPPPNSPLRAAKPHRFFPAKAADSANHVTMPALEKVLSDMSNKLIGMIGDMGTKVDADIAALRQENAFLSTSIKNVQTQVLEGKGRFDPNTPKDESRAPPPLHKLRFPKYDGSEDLIAWLHKGEQFFRVYATPDHLKVPTATFYIEGPALRKTRGVNRRFGPPLRSNPFWELLHLRRTGTVEEEFLLLLARCDDVSEAQQLSIFMVGLLEPLKTDVELQKPTTLDDAMALARAFERRLQVDTPPFLLALVVLNAQDPSWRVGFYTNTPPKGRFKRLSREEMAQRLLKGLCFNCPEKFSKEHAKSCSGKGVYYLDLAIDDDLGDDTSDEDMRISLTFQLHATIQGSSTTALVDSRSTHCFVAASVAERMGLVPNPRPGLSVGVANGDRVPSSSVCPVVPVDIHGELFSIDLYVIPLDSYGFILGCDWLRSLGPILWDLSTLSMDFWCHDHKVHWHGVSEGSLPRLSMMQLDNPLAALLVEFVDLFATPTGFPRLAPSITGFSSCPTPHLWLCVPQCKFMLEQGLIHASTAAFSSPVLLVCKRDGSWRFCVDYRALNSKTVRDKFSILIVEELLDELKDVVFCTKLDLRSRYHQVRMHQDDVAKMAFRTHHGHFEFLVMPFGLTNAPSTFQALMNEGLQPFLRKCIHPPCGGTASSPSARSVCPRNAASTISAMDTDKVAAVQEWPLPKSLKALRGFLGLTGYYRRFIHKYGIMAAPLTSLLKRDTFQWREAATSAFHDLKRALTTRRSCNFPTLRRRLWSTVMLRVLASVLCSAKVRDLSLFSHTKLAAYEQELIVLVQAMRHWRPYLWTTEFIPGKFNAAADALLRRDEHAPCTLMCPFQVVERMGSVAYRLRLPPKARIHDAFHEVFLKKHNGELPTSMGSLPPIAHGHVLPVPAKVLRVMPASDSWKLLVQWEGRPAADATWEILADFKELYPSFKLEDELFRQGEASVVDAFFGKKYQRRLKARASTTT
nr:unnamed protein product [Digitaria exilis]